MNLVNDVTNDFPTKPFAMVERIAENHRCHPRRAICCPRLRAGEFTRRGNMHRRDLPEPRDWKHDIFRADAAPFDPKEIEQIRKLTGKE